MNLMLKLAFRNVFRNFRRSLLTFLSITIGISISLVMVSFTVGLEITSIRAAINTRTGHVKLYNRNYPIDDLRPGLDHIIDSPNRILKLLDESELELHSAERISFSASITDGVEELNLIGIGINLDREDKVFSLKKSIIKGNYLTDGTEQILLSDIIAGLFELEVGDFLTILSRTKYNSINAIDVEISGLYHINNPQINNQNFFIPLSTAQEFLDMENQVSEIVVKGITMENSDILLQNIMNEVNDNGLAAFNWEYLLTDLLKLFELRAKSRQVTYIIMFIMAAAGVTNTMLMAVFERIREIGTLMAMGMRRKKILILFTLEAMFIGIFGSLTGCLIGGSIGYYFKFNGLSLASLGVSGIENLPITPIIYTYINGNVMAAAFFIGVGVALLSAIYPAMKGSKLNPTEALRTH